MVNNYMVSLGKTIKYTAVVQLLLYQNTSSGRSFGHLLFSAGVRVRRRLNMVLLKRSICPLPAGL